MYIYLYINCFAWKTKKWNDRHLRKKYFYKSTEFKYGFPLIVCVCVCVADATCDFISAFFFHLHLYSFLYKIVTIKCTRTHTNNHLLKSSIECNCFFVFRPCAYMCMYLVWLMIYAYKYYNNTILMVWQCKKNINKLDFFNTLAF